MSWVLAATLVWMGLALVVAVVIGQGIRLADRKAAQAAAEPDAPNVVAEWVRPSAAAQTAAAAAAASEPVPAPRPAARAPVHLAHLAVVHDGVPATGRPAATRDTGRS